jgi:protein-disulfide isomerase
MENSNKSWYQKWWGRTIFIFGSLILIIIIALGFYFVNLVKKIRSGEIVYEQLATQTPSYKSEDHKKQIEGINNYWLGSANPKLTIVEFGDFNCSLCKNSYSKMREISLKYKENVKIIYRDFPNFENSINKAMAARCAGEQGLFWLMHDKLFQNLDTTSNDELISLAMQVGVNSAKFATCLNSNKYLQDIQKDYSDAEGLELIGTPTWFFNGYKIEGDIPYDTFIKIVESIL